MMKKLVLFLSLGLLWGCGQPSSSPSLLEQIQAGKINPMCLRMGDQQVSVGQIVLLENCTENTTLDKTEHDENGAYTAFFHFDGNESIAGRGGPFISYSSLGFTEDGLIVALSWSNGGSNQSSATIKLQQVDQTLRVAETYTFGEGCYGGLADMVVENGQLSYRTNLPRNETLALGTTKEWEYLNFPDIPRDPATCFALKEYVDGVFSGVRLSADFATNLERYKVSETQKPKQYCFDQHFLTAFQDGQRFFTVEGLSTIISEIEQACLVDPVPAGSHFTIPETTFADVSQTTRDILELCANGDANACDQTRSNDEITDHEFSIIHRQCNGGSKPFCTLLDNLIAAEIRDQ